MPTVLLLAASPLDQDRLRCNAEMKKIRQALERSKNRENWQIITNEAATVENLRRQLLDHQPTVVHFSGHGGGEDGLYFESDDGHSHPTHAAPLAKLFHLVKDGLKCVVLNTCYSSVQADVIRQNIDYVVGMNTAIDDDAATKFAVAFYDALFAGMDFRTAFNFGCTAIDLSNLPGIHAPVFLESPQLGGAQLQYTDNIPEIENFLLGYLNTPFGARYPLTTKGQHLADTMQKYYLNDMFTRFSTVTVVSTRQIDDCYWKVNARIIVAGERAFRNYYLRIKDRVIRIDWEASAGIWSMPCRTFLARGADKAIVARVTAEIGNSYYGDFRGKANFVQNVNLATIEGNTLYAYAARNDPKLKEFHDLIEDGKSHDITVLLCNTGDAEHPVITELLSCSWIIPETVDVT